MRAKISNQKTEVQSSINPGFATATTESSIENLLTIWQRRRNWHQKAFKSSTSMMDNNVVASWRLHLVNLLDSPLAHIIAIFLLVLDLALCVIELSSSVTAASCKNNDNNVAILGAWYHWLEVAILSFLFLRVVLLAVGLGRAFSKKPGYVVDCVVVGVALVLEAVLETVGGGLLVVVSLWRVVRAVESLYELSDDAIGAKIEEVVCQFDVLREENMRLLEAIAEEGEITTNIQEQVANLF